jgi:hypothetical protein
MHNISGGLDLQLTPACSVPYEPVALSRVMTLSPRDRRLCKAKIESLTPHEGQTIIFLNNREGFLLGYLEMIKKKFVQALLRC